MYLWEEIELIMEKLIINGGHRLQGRVKISGAKNAVLPIIAATLLGQEAPSRLEEVPSLEDVHTITEVLGKLGVQADFDADKNTLFVDSSVIASCEAPYDLVRKMRASILVLGPLLARAREAKVSLPGGCATRFRSLRMRTLPCSCSSLSKSKSTSTISVISVLGVASALMPLLGNAKSEGVNTADCAY